VIEVEWQDEELKRVLAKADRQAELVVRACVKRLHRHWVPIIENRADNMVPMQLGILANSKEVLKAPWGFSITYGGKASAYARYQHEGENLQHHPPSNRYTYEGGIYTEDGGAAGGPGDWNDPRKLVFGKYPGKNKWRYREKQYGRRSERSSHPQNPQATHHWLYGRAHSAFDSNRDRLNQDLTDVGATIVRELLRAS